MAEIRLSKLTKQFSIGLQRLVDFLNEKGANVEMNPNAKVSDEYLPAIEAKFGEDQKLKEDSEQVTIKLKEIIELGSKKKPEHEEEEGESGSLLKDILVLVGSAILIAVGADMLEGSSVSLSLMAGIPTEVVGVTVVALCTSLPELVTAVTALMKGHGALSLGNIIGANIFNLVLVSGAAVTISPFVIPEGSKLFGYNTSQLFEIPLMVGVMALMTLPALAKGKLRRWQGVSLLTIYGLFVALQVLIALKVF